jgi:hypothetical protein
VNVQKREEHVIYTWGDGTVIYDSREHQAPLIDHDPDERARIEAERPAARTDGNEERRQQGDPDPG